jgi:Na+:H+ antiporter
VQDLIYLAIIWGVVLIAVYFARKTRLTPVLWFLFFGALLVNIGLLPQETSPFIQVFSDLGIIIIMFALGFEENSSTFLKSIKRSWGIALFGALAPFAAAYSVAIYFWQDTNIALLCGMAMTATAVSLTMVTLRNEGINRTPVAMGIMTSAVLDDIASLAMVAILIPLATGGASVSIAGIAMIVLKAILFFVIVSALGGWLFTANEGPLKKIPLIGRFHLRHLLLAARGEHATLILLLLAVIVGLLAHEFGFHPAVGAYMAGLILKDEYFHLTNRPEKTLYIQTKGIIESIAFSWIGPVFFVTLGTKLVFDPAIFFTVIDEAVILTLGIFFSQVISAALAARYTGGFSMDEGVMIGFGMLGRAELAFVVMDLAYNQNHILTTEAFYTLMFAAFWLNVAVPVTIRWWKPYFTGEKRSIFSKAATEKTEPEKS